MRTLHPHPWPVLHRLRNMIGHDHVAARQVCDCAGQLQDTVIGADRFGILDVTFVSQVFVVNVGDFQVDVNTI